MLKLATKFRPEAAAFELAVDAGFGHAEIWLSTEWLRRWEEVADLARRHRMGYALHFPNKGRLTPELLHATVELCHAVDASALVVHQPMFDRHAGTLLGFDPALKLAVENHKLSPVELQTWAADNPGLTLDVEHLWKFTLGDGPLDDLLHHVRGLLDEFGPKLRHVHLPGYRPGRPEHHPMSASPKMVLAVLAVLEEAGFAGLVVSEANEEFQNLRDLRRDVDLFESWATARVSA